MIWIRVGIHNSKIFFYHSIKNICCDLSFEPSWRDGYSEELQNMFYEELSEIILRLSQTFTPIWASVV